MKLSEVNLKERKPEFIVITRKCPEAGGQVTGYERNFIYEI